MTMSLLMRLLWAAAFVLPALEAHAGVIYTNLHSFDSTDGEYPQAGLVQGSDGYFYGTTYGGGTSGSYGTVFKIGTNGVLTSLYTFNFTDGDNPEAALVQGNDGNLYGTTYRRWHKQPPSGLWHGVQEQHQRSADPLIFIRQHRGRVWCAAGWGPPERALDAGQRRQFLWHHTLWWNERNSRRHRVQDRHQWDVHELCITSPAALMAILPRPGWCRAATAISMARLTAATMIAYGNVFKISTNGVQTNLYTFTGGADGANPYAGLVQGSDGNFYGTTTSGGTYTNGTVFRISPMGR